MNPTLIWLLETSEIQQNRWKTERGKKIPKKINGWTEGGSDSPFVRHKREEVHKGCINRICAKERKGNFTQTRSYLARKQLYTHCLNPLLTLSSLPCYLRGWRSLYPDGWAKRFQMAVSTAASVQSSTSAVSHRHRISSPWNISSPNLIQLQKTSSLPCYLRRRRRKKKK